LGARKGDGEGLLPRRGEEEKEILVKRVCFEVR
jgi:hypothetical protein